MKLQRFAAIVFTAFLAAVPLAGCQAEMDASELGPRLTSDDVTAFMARSGVDAEELKQGGLVLTSSDGTAENLSWERVSSEAQASGTQAQGVCTDCCTAGYCCLYAYECSWSPSTGQTTCYCSVWGCCQPPGGAL